MKIFRWTAALTLGLALAPLAVQAQDVTLGTRSTLLPTTNTREINVAGSVSFDGPKPYAFSALYGLFVSPKVEVGGVGTVAGAKGETALTAIGGFADYYFRGNEAIETTNALLPYLGIFAGYSHKDESDGSLGAQGGVKYFFNPNVAGTIEYQYRSTRHGAGINQIILGFSTFFR